MKEPKQEIVHALYAPGFSLADIPRLHALVDQVADSLTGHAQQTRKKERFNRSVQNYARAIANRRGIPYTDGKMLAAGDV